MGLAPFALEPRAVRVPTRPADPVAANAELFSGASVAPRARGGVDSSLRTVIAAPGARRDPPLRMGATRAGALSDMVPVVAALARALAVARGAKPRVCAGLERVPCAETGSVKTGERDLVEREPRRKRGDGPDAMTGCARALRMAARAKVARASRAHPVLTQPVAIVNQVSDRRRVLRAEALVAAIARAKRPRVLMLVATEARRHLRSQGVRGLLRDRLVASHTVSMGDGLVSPVLEAETLTRDPRPLPSVGGSMAREARVRVVRLRVATDAGRVGREVKRLHVPRELDALMAVDTIDPMRRVRAVLEGVRFVRRAQAEHASARGERERKDGDERERKLHGLPQLRERRASTFAS